MRTLTTAIAFCIVAASAATASAAPPTMTAEEIIALGATGVGYSYYWGHGSWRSDHTQLGSCSGSCPSCSHSGSYGADCSGFVAKAWQVPSASPVTTNSHPYSTYHFTCTDTHWQGVSRGNAKKADAASYRNTGCPGSAGHVVLYESGDPWGSMKVYESRGCSSGIMHASRTLSSSYRFTRRNNLGSEPPACVAATEVCNGADDDCDGSVDEGEVCLIEQDSLHQAHIFDPPTTSDINGDGIADICARAAAGVRCYISDGNGVTETIVGPELSDASGWSDETNYSTLRMADIDGDGLADICARGNAGLFCWKSTGTGFGPAITGPAFADDSSWNNEKYFSTIRMADINGDGKADVCARAAAGLRCYLSNGEGFGAAIVGPEISNASGWGTAEHYGTIRMGDVNGDGKDDVCVRGNAGMFCWLSDGNGFPTQVLGPAWSDENGWTNHKYWSTIRLADIDGDGKADICGRTSTDFRCHLSEGTGFGGAIIGPAMADSSGWGDYDNYATIRMGDVTGDGKADICARANAGMRCWASTGTGFGASFTGPELSNAIGWDDAKYFRTISLGDIDGDGLTDICGRGSDGYACWRADGSGFGSKFAGPALRDDTGWSKLQYYSTIRVGGSGVTPCVAAAEACDGVDNDCDGTIDEDGVCDQPDADPVTPPADGGDPGDTGGVWRDTWTGPPPTAPDGATLSDAPNARPDAEVGPSGEADAGTDLTTARSVDGGCACSALHSHERRGAGGALALLACIGLVAIGRRRLNWAEYFRTAP